MKKTNFKQNLDKKIKEIRDRNKARGITLIALVITIVILLILAGITISTLKQSNLFNKAKNAKEKWKVAKQDEENKINEYSDQIDLASSRDTIILTEEEYNSIFSTPGKKSINLPNTWTIGTEYSWGNGANKIYGQRFKGDSFAKTVTNSVTNVYGIVNYGGYLTTSGNERIGSGLNPTESNWSIFANPSNVICISWGSAYLSNLIGHPYDIWVLYTKIN